MTYRAAPLTLMTSALGYAERLGCAVIPTGPDCKPGSIRKWWVAEDSEEKKNFAAYDGTKDSEVIRSIWARYPKANVSIVTGAMSGGLLVLDIDRHGKDDGFQSLALLEAIHGPLPLTWRSTTPSTGEHRWFRQPAALAGKLRNKVGLRTYNSDGRVQDKFLGLDIRTDGGVAAAAPSTKPTGTYRWADHPLKTDLADAPLWLLKMCLDPPAPPKPDRAPLRRDTAARMARYVEKAIDGECGEVARMAAGSGRNQRLFQAACRLGSLVGANLLPQDLAEAELVTASDACGLLREDGLHSVRATILSGLRKGIAQPREVAT